MSDEGERIRSRFNSMKSAVSQIVDYANSMLKTRLEPGYEFEFRSSRPGSILTSYEKGQVLCFVLRFLHLPVLKEIRIQEVDGSYYPSDIDYTRHTLNEYRSLLENEGDSIHYRKIHNFCRQMLERRDPAKGPVCTVHAADESDATDEYLALLGERVKAISHVRRALEFDYLYNGILQHSDDRHSERFVSDYTSRELNYVLLKHAYALAFIKELLKPHCDIVHSSFYPTMGGL